MRSRRLATPAALAAAAPDVPSAGPPAREAVLGSGTRTFAMAAVAVACGLAAAPAHAQEQGLVEQLRASADGSVDLRTRGDTDRAAFIAAGRNGDLLPAAAAGAPQAKTGEFLAHYGALLGVEGDSTLAQTASAVDAAGATHVTYEQRYRGLPVFGAQVKAHVDAVGDLTAVNGVAVPDLDVSVRPRLSAAAAVAPAVAEVAAENPSAAAPLRATSAVLGVYRTGLIRGLPGTNELAYQVDVEDAAGVRERVFVHANAGKVLNRFRRSPDALHRVLSEQTPANEVWREGDPFPGALNPDQRNIVQFSGDTYRLFANTFGRDSYDGAGASLRALANDPAITCPNANWSGTRANFCNGVTADDLVAHEWAHAYTEFTHDLIYQWQPGALNESYSDIWGEVVDRINGAGTDAPDVRRAVGQCSAYERPLPVLTINRPAAIAGDCAAGPAYFGPPVTRAGTTGDVVLTVDGIAGPDTSTTNGCTPPFANSLAGRIALIDRGVCSFSAKVKNAEQAGAIAVIIGNTADATQQMQGVDDVGIPSLLIALAHRNLIAGRLAAGETVNVTLRAEADTVESYRWLMFEDASAFEPTAPPGGAAIRDMWDPTCLSDPGKVTDAEYFCATGDSGGVHYNSGVPNHGFALLVDGGTYNGQTVTGLGLTKVAHIYWRAQTVYQTLASGFADHADALEASCRDLIGKPLTALSTRAPAGPSGASIGPVDCAAVSAMAAAVELRTSPTLQCNFRPLLEPGDPPLCGRRDKREVAYSADFRRGLQGWTRSSEGRYAGWPQLNWHARSALPGGRDGWAAFAPDPPAGNCDLGAGDISGVMRMTSPAIRLPADRWMRPRLTFEHYVATEAGYDGGNVKISINGGPFELVPAAAFLFNGYPGVLTTEAGGSTNPLAGEPAFTGTDGGEVTGSWAVSHVDLAAVGVRPRDRIRVRFDMGIDGCYGIDGWYVDNVKVQGCKPRGRKP